MFYKWLFFLYLLPVALVAQTGQSVKIYQENSLWGLREATLITPAVYDTLIRIPKTDYLIAKKHGKGSNAFGIISTKGKTVISFSYWSITPSGNHFIVSKRENNRVIYGIISSSNKIVLNNRFAEIKAFNNNWYAKTFAGDLQLFNANGNLIKSINADSISLSNNKQYLKIYKQGKIGLLNQQGDVLFEPKFKHIKSVDGKWITIQFPTWTIITQKDTSVVFADSIKIWDSNYTINGINNNYFITSRKKQISANYKAIEIVSSNFALAKKSGLYGVINKSGEEIMPPSFRTIQYAKGYFYTKNSNYWSVYDSLGKKRSVFKYDSVGSISNGLFPIKRKGKWGFMDRNGKEIIHCIYNSPAFFKKGKAIINYFGAYGIIDLQGNWIVKPRAGIITDYSFNFYIYKKGTTYYLNNYNNELLYFTSNRLIFKNETIFEVRDGYTNRVSSLGTLVENAPENTQGSSSWKIIKVGQRYGFENQEGVLKITYRYDSLLLFSEGLAAFKLRGKWGFIDIDENIKIQPVFTKVTPFKNKISIITQHSKTGLLQIDGHYLLKPKFDSISRIEHNLWRVEENGFEGIYNSEGHIIVQPKFKKIVYLKEDLILVIKNKKYGTVNNKGQSVLPRIYDYIGYNAEHNLLTIKQIP